MSFFKKIRFLKLLPFWIMIGALFLPGPAPTPVQAATVEYDLYLDYQEVNFTGRPVKAMTVNGNIPGPTLEMTEGDLVKVRVHNRMPVETSIHWHGILLPNKEDGVPYLTTPPIKPGRTREFSFPVIQSGTYWYHSHTSLQEQLGVYGSIVIHPGHKHLEGPREYVLVFSDWTDENPDEVLRTLKRGSEYYSLKKGAMQSLAGAIEADALTDVWNRALQRMPPMDISDVGYDLFLVNGRPETELEAAPGETVRLRIVNASASTYFYLQFAGGPLKIVAADGPDVQPADEDRLLIAIAETYDVLVTLPHGERSWEFRATAQDGSGSASAFLGRGRRVPAPDVPRPDLYRMHSGHGDMAMDMSGGHEREAKPQSGADMPAMTPPPPSPAHDHDEAPHQGQAGPSHDSMEQPMAAMPETPSAHTGHEAASTPAGTDHPAPAAPSSPRPMPPYPRLRSVKPTSLPADWPTREIHLTLTGDMERYVWSFNNRVLSEADNILIRRGENVRLFLENTTMMHHPIHLHGHFFRVLNGQGDHAPLKHTVDVPPMGRQVIEFAGREDKDWFFHCHILYHMKAGMARVFEYEGSTIDPEIQAARKDPANPMGEDPFFFWADAAVLSQMSLGRLTAANTRHIITGSWEADWEDRYDAELVYEYYHDRFFRPFVGGKFTDEDERGLAGVWYLLPLNFESRAYIDTEGDVTFELENDLQLTNRLNLFGQGEYRTDGEWEGKAGLEFSLTKHLSLLGLWHSDYGPGAGLEIHF